MGNYTLQAINRRWIMHTAGVDALDANQDLKFYYLR